MRTASVESVTGDSGRVLQGFDGYESTMAIRGRYRLENGPTDREGAGFG